MSCPFGASAIFRFCGEPFILKMASTLPTRSTTEITAGRLRAFASATAWAMICCTSLMDSDSSAGGV